MLINIVYTKLHDLRRSPNPQTGLQTLAFLNPCEDVVMRAPFTSSAYKSAGTPPRPRSAIERTYLEGLQAISQLEGFERESRAATATAEGGLVAGLALEILLDVRDLVAECAWRLSDLFAERNEH